MSWITDRKNSLRAAAKQVKFLLNRDPLLVKEKNWRPFIKEPYEAVVIFSADFELAWAWRYTKSSHDPLQKTLDKARLERDNMPLILEHCEKYQIPVTWLTVGHLFLESCSREGALNHAGMPRPGHFENDWWRFTGNDWYEYDPCTNYREDPLWYAPDLVKNILGSTVNHEIGSHTFSHIDCRDEVCSNELFEVEIRASLEAASGLGISSMESFVHPGHTIGHLDDLYRNGFTNFRTDYRNTLGFPVRHASGLWEFSTSLEFDLVKGWSEKQQVERFLRTFRRAFKHHTLAYTWFHPSMNPVMARNVMPKVFEWLDAHRDRIWIVTQGEYIQWLNEHLK